MVANAVGPDVFSAAENSTNVRPRNKLDEALYQGAWPLRALAQVNTKLAAMAAARAFFTTYRAPLRAEEVALLSQAERLSIRFGKQTLPAWSYGEGPTVLLSHGWSGRGAQLAPLAAALATAGFRAVTFDHPAHGESEGKRTNVVEMAHALAEVDAALHGVHAIVAHSLGALAVTRAMSRTVTPKRVVFIAPPTAPLWPERFAAKLGLDAQVAAATRTAIERSSGIQVASLDPRTVASDMKAPLLVVHDRGDREVPFAEGESLVEVWPNAELLATEGLGHHKILRSPEVGEAVLRFLKPLQRGR